ncbi:MAG: flavin reductase family protein [Parvibaculaceae bacterium]
MASIASSVTVVTTDGRAGRFGQTVSSFCSVSADPPQMLGCLRSESPICAAIDVNRCFTINILSDNQAPVANVFAGRAERGASYDFSTDSWIKDCLGCPVLPFAPASFSCALHNRVLSGTHCIYIGRVVSVGRAETSPLIYRARAYGRCLPLS